MPPILKAGHDNPADCCVMGDPSKRVEEEVNRTAPHLTAVFEDFMDAQDTVALVRQTMNTARRDVNPRLVGGATGSFRPWQTYGGGLQIGIAPDYRFTLTPTVSPSTTRTTVPVTNWGQLALRVWRGGEDGEDGEGATDHQAHAIHRGGAVQVMPWVSGGSGT